MPKSQLDLTGDLQIAAETASEFLDELLAGNYEELDRCDAEDAAARARDLTRVISDIIRYAPRSDANAEHRLTVRDVL